jgi:hypothetical protein
MDSFLWVLVGFIMLGVGWMAERIAQNKKNKTIQSEVRDDYPRLIRRR